MIEQSTIAGHAPAVVVGGPAGLVFLSGIRPEASAGSPPPLDVRAQAELAADRLRAVLAARGLSWENVAKTLVYVTDISELGVVRDVLAERFGTQWRPAFTVVQVDNLPTPGARVQLDVTAAG
ncbi:RidA family protein [Microbacterium sp.]|uniref:RidA family protein n=1 Tax=Microbacterium sp. TaxID=51671 RepID=UPI002D774D04|nr:RidA family protein [Microbacterium sp.]HET6300929.1 RidA family protein [Microbacterium sp.]